MILEAMSEDLAVPISYIEGLARGASHEYKTYNIPKRSGGHRTINHPSKRLKALQRWLLHNVVKALPIHPAAMAYRAGYSILDNAKKHAPSRYLLRMDFEAFFPSIQTADMSLYMSDHAHLFRGWTPGDVEAFARLVLRNGALTIGAPTSPGVSNALCHELDSRLDALAAAEGVVYTRYADDLFFSTTHRDVLARIEPNVADVVRSLRTPTNLKLNALKTRHSSRKDKRRVTGITIGSDGRPHLGRDRKREIRALIHRHAVLKGEERAYLAGLISFAIGIEPQFLNDLIKKYGLTRVRDAARRS